MRNFIGVDLGGTNIRAAIVSEDGTIKCMKKSESHPERGAEAVMETMISLIESLDGYEECEGIGMGIPGPIDTINGKIIVSTNLPKLIGFPIAEYIENHFHKPTYMDNDVKVAALGEAVQGAGKDYPIVYYVTISTGVGGALVIDQKVIGGQNGHAGEIGNICIDRNREKYYGVATNKKAPLWKYVLVVVFAGGASLALNNLILIGNLSALSATYETTATSMYSAPFAVQIVCLAILSPIAEELVFRGLMFRRMREDTGAKLAIIYTSVVFGIFHGNFVQMLYGFLMGLMFAWLCEKYGSVLAPIVAHVTANLLALFATKYQIFDRMMADIRVIGMVTVGAATIAAIIYLQIKQIDEKPTGYSENKEIS